MCIYVYLNIYIYMYIYIYKQLYIRIYIYIHTYNMKSNGEDSQEWTRAKAIRLYV